MLNEQAPQSDAGPAASGKARFFHSGNAFNIKLPPVPRHQFLAERDRAFDPAEPTGLIPLDLSGTLGCEFPATTPLILTRYMRLRAGANMETGFKASGEIFYVIQGSGESVKGGERIAWNAGDLFCFPGGGTARHYGGDADSVLWIVTDEPTLAFLRMQPLPAGEQPVQAVHFHAADIARHLDEIYAMDRPEDMAGLALVFSSEAMERSRNIMPSLTLALNSLPPGEAQQAHRHNSVAVTLSIQGDGCHSIIDGERIDWQPNAVTVTPPGEVHSHHNHGDARALFLIVQDGGLHYHCRTMGFEVAG